MSGMYTCHNQSLTVKVLDMMEPTPILWNLNNHTEKVNISHPVYLYCESDGSPSPLVTWYKDDLLLRPAGDPNFVINGSHLAIKTFLVNNPGLYKCVVSNIGGEVMGEIHLDYISLFLDDRIINKALVGCLSFLRVLIVIVSTAAVHFFRKRRVRGNNHLRRKLLCLSKVTQLTLTTRHTACRSRSTCSHTTNALSSPERD